MAELTSHPDEIKVVSKRFGKGAADIEQYLKLDGYKAVQKALTMSSDEIINEVKASSLRGRGGAGFPTGMKWSFVPKESAKPKYILVNGDESEPGTCKDRLILEHDPHSVIEGVIIAGLAVGAKLGFVYIRGEYRYLVDIMRKAIDDAYAKGFLGKNIFGSGKEFDVRWHTGAGAYEVGEESALMESLASVPHIIMMGGQKFADYGPPKNGGTRLFCLSGHINKPGVYELPLGYPLKKMIYEVGGGIPGGKKLKAVVPGGSSTLVLTAEEAEQLNM